MAGSSPAMTTWWVKEKLDSSVRWNDDEGCRHARVKLAQDNPGAEIIWCWQVGAEFVSIMEKKNIATG
jgi:hypothetical protein